MTEDECDILVDSREPDKIADSLKSLDLDVEVTSLPVADIIFDDLGIERKTISDFISSMKPPSQRPPRTPRLWDQAADLKDNFETPLIIITGLKSNVNTKYIRYSSKQVQGAKAKLLLKFGIPIIQLEDTTELIEFIYRLYKTKHPKRTPTRPYPYTKKNAPIKIKVENMLAQIPGIGVKKSAKLLKYGGSLKGVLGIPDDKLVSLIGKKTAHNLIRASIQEIKYEDD